MPLGQTEDRQTDMCGGFRSPCPAEIKPRPPTSTVILNNKLELLSGGEGGTFFSILVFVLFQPLYQVINKNYTGLAVNNASGNQENNGICLIYGKLFYNK